MLVKSRRYYYKTAVSRLVAYGCSMLDKLGLLYWYKRRNQLFYQNAVAEFSYGIAEPMASQTPLYITYCHFHHPSELGKHLLFDEDGVALCRYDVQPAFYNPLTAAHYALICYNFYLKTGEKSVLDQFWRQVFFLEKYGTVKDGHYWLHYKKDLPKFGLKAPWASGLTQTVVMSVFIRAAILSNEVKYELLVEQLYSSLFVSLENGGVFRYLPDGEPWLEEYASSQPDMTLNGFVFCLVGLYEHYHFTQKNPLAEAQLSKLVYSFFNHLHWYVFGKYTKYHLRTPVFHNVEYQGIYPLIFLHLYRLSGKRAFWELACFYNKNTSWDAFNEFFDLPLRGGELIEPFFQDEIK